MSGFVFKEGAYKVRGPRLMLNVDEAEHAQAVARECGLQVQIISYEGETYTKEAPIGSPHKEETHTVPKGSVYVEVVHGVGVGNLSRFWVLLKRK